MAKGVQSLEILGHPNSLKRIASLIKEHNLVERPICVNTNEETISIGSVQLSVMLVLGHTDGHVALYDHRSRTLIAGDHIVGWGSSTHHALHVLLVDLSLTF